MNRKSVVEKYVRTSHLSVPEMDFDGAVIFEQDGKYVVLTKKETGLLRFGETDRKGFDDSDSAILYGVK